MLSINAKTSGNAAIIGTVQRDPVLAFDRQGTENSTTPVPSVPRRGIPRTDRAAGLFVHDPGSDNWGWMHLLGDGAEDETGEMLIEGWRRQPYDGAQPQHPDTGNYLQDQDLWVPDLLGRVTFTLGPITGLGDGPIPPNFRFAKAIAVVEDYTYQDPGLTVQNPPSNIARAYLDYEGHQLVSFTLAKVSIANTANVRFWTT